MLRVQSATEPVEVRVQSATELVEVRVQSATELVEVRVQSANKLVEVQLSPSIIKSSIPALLRSEDNSYLLTLKTQTLKKCPRKPNQQE